MIPLLPIINHLTTYRCCNFIQLFSDSIFIIPFVRYIAIPNRTKHFSSNSQDWDAIFSRYSLKKQKLTFIHFIFKISGLEDSQYSGTSLCPSNSISLDSTWSPGSSQSGLWLPHSTAGSFMYYCGISSSLLNISAPSCLLLLWSPHWAYSGLSSTL